MKYYKIIFEKYKNINYRILNFQKIDFKFLRIFRKIDFEFKKNRFYKF